MIRLLVAAAMLAGGLATAAPTPRPSPAAGSHPPRSWARRPILNETYTCRFRRHGLVTIDTRDPGATITYRGRAHPAADGSYFYQATDDPEIALMFKPGMRRWFWDDGDEAACTRRSNLR